MTQQQLVSRLPYSQRQQHSTAQYRLPPRPFLPTQLLTSCRRRLRCFYVSCQLGGIGINQCWSLSPAIDLLDGEFWSEDALQIDAEGEGEGEDVHVLLAGVGDICHALKTYSLSHQHQQLRNKHIHVSSLHLNQRRAPLTVPPTN